MYLAMRPEDLHLLRRDLDLDPEVAPRPRALTPLLPPEAMETEEGARPEVPETDLLSEAALQVEGHQDPLVDLPEVVAVAEEEVAVVAAVAAEVDLQHLAEAVLRMPMTC
jgi:hypothetical protein